MKSLVLVLFATFFASHASADYPDFVDAVNEHLMLSDVPLAKYVTAFEAAQEVACVLVKSETHVFPKEMDYEHAAVLSFSTDFNCFTDKDYKDIVATIHVVGDIYSRTNMSASKIEWYYHQ